MKPTSNCKYENGLNDEKSNICVRDKRGKKFEKVLH